MEIQCGIETFGLSLYEESSFTQIMGGLCLLFLSCGDDARSVAETESSVKTLRIQASEPFKFNR